MHSLIFEWERTIISVYQHIRRHGGSEFVSESLVLFFPSKRLITASDEQKLI